MSSRVRASPPCMTTTTSLDLTPTVTEASRVVAAVQDDQLSRPTPCADTSVAAPLVHLHGRASGLRLAAEKLPPGAPSASAQDLPADWRSRIPRELDELAAAW